MAPGRVTGVLSGLGARATSEAPGFINIWEVFSIFVGALIKVGSGALSFEVFIFGASFTEKM